uniref:Putative ribonuclease H-like domain-containing protein n=1 Tax=Tanacetum cinerariifolium TaxID=118510 RepID=A0A6L2NVU7_TANCI|nr:putative ribonuclease H-like domain-containing protein [Tanacetum cinerariifolium]
MVEMCLCDVDRMAAMGMWFDCMAVIRIGYNLGKCCHIVSMGCRMMVVHFLEILDHFIINTKTSTLAAQTNIQRVVLPRSCLAAVMCKQAALIPPSYTGNFMPSKPDLILADMDEYVVSESVTSVPAVATNKAKTKIDGGYVDFEGDPKGGKITGKGKISIDTECVVLSPNFKLLDESQILLRVPRKNNMYSIDLKNVAPLGCLTCLFVNAILYESNLWHRRLGHINFKTMNKLVKGNLVRGLPSKFFEKEHTCVACQKGKKHKASCKTKNISSINQPLQMLHMDLFDLTFVKSLMKRMYCLVFTDNFSRFSWVFFLATKDQTSGTLKAFITGLENQMDHKVKIIRCDNRTEFKNKEMNLFYEKQGSGPTWPFDIDTLTKSMNYKPVFAGNQSNGSAGVKRVPDKDYILLSLWTQDPLFYYSSKDSPGDGCKPSGEEETKDAEDPIMKIMSPTANTASTKDNAVDENILYGFARIEAIRLFLAYASFKDFIVYQMDVKSAFLYGKIEEEVYVCQPLEFEDPEFPDRVYKVEKALYGLHQAPRTWKEMRTEFEKMMHKKFQMSSIGELTFFLGLFSTVKTASTPIETSKPLLKDENTKDVDVHLYRSMIGSLMYLTSLRPDIMFDTRNPQQEVVNFLGVVSNSTTEAEYVAAANCCGQIIDFLNANPINNALTVNPTIYTLCIEQFWVTAKAKNINGEAQIHAKVDGKNVIISKETIRRDLKFKDEGGVDCLSNEVSFEQLPLMGKQKPKRTRRKDTELPQTSVSTEVVADEAVYEEMYDSVEKAATTVTGLDTTQAKEISSFKRRVKRLENKKMSRTHRIKRLYKVGLSIRVESFVEEQSLDEEDASKQGRNIADIDADAETTLVDETAKDQGSKPKIRGIVIRDHEELSKSKTTTSPTSVADSIRPKAKGIVMQEPSEATTATTLIPTHVKDKGKGKMVKPEMPLKKKAQIEKALEANIAEWDDVQAMMDADYELAVRKRHFAKLKIAEKKRKPPTKAQKRNQMCAYLKNTVGFTHNPLKNKIFDEIQKDFDRTMSWINSFMDTKVVKDKAEGSEIRAQESSKRAGEDLQKEFSKKQKVDDDQEAVELKRCLEIVPDDEDDVTIDATPLSSKSPTIIDYKIHKEGRKTYFQIIRADGSSQMYYTFSKMLKNFNKEDLKNTTYYLLVENMYPLINYTLTQMWNDVRLQVDYEVEMASDLLKLVNMDNPNIKMEEYIRLEEEKAHRISFDESDDEDYKVVFDKNSFSYKITYVNDLKKDSKNDTDKVNMPSFLSPEPVVSYFDDLDYFKDFEKEFTAIVYNDALTSKLDLLTEPTISPQHINKFNLKDEASLLECDKEKQNILNFNDLFPFNVIYPNDSKLNKDNDDDKVDIEPSSRDLSVKLLLDVINTDDGSYAQRSNKY